MHSVGRANFNSFPNERCILLLDRRRSLRERSVPFDSETAGGVFALSL